MNTKLTELKELIQTAISRFSENYVDLAEEMLEINLEPYEVFDLFVHGFNHYIEEFNLDKEDFQSPEYNFGESFLPKEVKLVLEPRNLHTKNYSPNSYEDIISFEVEYKNEAFVIQTLINWYYENESLEISELFLKDVFPKKDVEKSLTEIFEKLNNHYSRSQLLGLLQNFC